LFFPEYTADLEKKLEYANAQGVLYFLSVSTSPENISQNIFISNTHRNVFCSVGIHPCHADDLFDTIEITKYIGEEKVIAIGEVGLDYFYDNPLKSSQKQLLSKMLELSEELPYIFHARDCFPDILEILADHKGKKGVFHCYTGSLENAAKILDMGFYISFSGVITFKNSNEIRNVLRYIPDDRLLVETDSPYLAPVPFRGKTNEPGYVRIVAEKMAEVRETSLEHIAQVTTSNFFNLFNKAKRFAIDDEK
jgi:TatD DNase family protein